LPAVPGWPARSVSSVPRGVTHTFANPGPGPARILVIGSSPVLALVDEMGRLAQANRLTKENVADVYAV
jgi:hypothetical protein